MKQIKKFFNQHQSALALGLMVVGLGLALGLSLEAGAGVALMGAGLGLRDVKSHFDISHSIAPQVITAGTITGVGVDLKGYDGAAVLFVAGAIVAAGNVTLSVEDSDDSTTGSDGTWGAVAAADLVGTLTTPPTQNLTQRVAYRGTKRWVRAKAVYASGTSVALSASVVRFKPHSAEAGL